MNLQQFVDSVESGEIKIIVGGKDNDGQFVSGFATDVSSLADEDLAAEAIALDVAGAIDMPFEKLVSAVNEARNTDLSEFSARARKKKRIYKRKKSDKKPDA